MALTAATGGGDDEEEEPRSTKRRKVDQGLAANADAHPSAAAGAASVSPPVPVANPTPTPPPSYKHAVAGGALLDLWDSCYVKDVRPLLSGCTCHACRHHTRAYLHHLLRAKEMLGEILLYCHNQHQYMLLFDSCRRCTGAGAATNEDRNGAFVAWAEGVVKQMCDDV